MSEVPVVKMAFALFGTAVIAPAATLFIAMVVLSSFSTAVMSTMLAQLSMKHLLIVWCCLGAIFTVTVLAVTVIKHMKEVTRHGRSTQER